MKRILTTTAIVAIAATPLFASSGTESMGTDAPEVVFSVEEAQYNLSNLLGARVYIAEQGSGNGLDQVDLTEPHENWEDIGEVGDVLMTPDGDIASVIVDVGGFLGLGEREVALQLDELSLKQDADDEGNVFVLFEGQRPDLESREGFDRAKTAEMGTVSARDHLEMATSDHGASHSNSSQKHAESDVEADVEGMTIRASELVGKPVYIRNNDAANAEIPNSIAEPSDEWDHIGEIGDVVIGREGAIKSVAIDAGGFLGIGEKHVSTSMDELKFVSQGEAEGEYFVVFTGDRSAIEDRETLDYDAARTEGDSFYVDDGWTQLAGKDIEKDVTETAADPQSDASDQSDHDRKVAELTASDRDALTANELVGLSVYDLNEERVGEIGNLVVSDDGKINQVIIDVGGFLGLGEKPVAIPFDELKLRKDDGTVGGLYATTEMSTDEFEAMQAWDG